jgi:hypothetical protein
MGPALRDEIGGLSPGMPAEGRMSPAARALLWSAGVLVEPGWAGRRLAAWEESRASSSRVFRDRGYVPLDRLLHPFHIASLRRHYRRLVRTGQMKLGDSGDPRRFIAYDEGVARFFHRQLASVVGAVAGVPVKPSYVYVVSYQSGAELRAHTDRAQCEYSITLLVDFTPEPEGPSPWPLLLDTDAGTVAVWQGLGDGLLYRGRRFPHRRTRLAEGMTSTSILFHYVDRDFEGPLG